MAQTELADFTNYKNKVLLLEDKSEKRLCIVRSFDESTALHTVHFAFILLTQCVMHIRPRAHSEYLYVRSGYT